MSEQIEMFVATSAEHEDVVALEAGRLLSEGRSVSAVIDVLLPAFGATLPAPTIFDVVMVASRRGRAWSR